MRVHGDLGYQRARGVFEFTFDVGNGGLNHANLLGEVALRQPSQLTCLPDSSAAKHQLFAVPVAFWSFRLMGRSPGTIGGVCVGAAARAGSGILTHQWASADFSSPYFGQTSQTAMRFFWESMFHRTARRRGSGCSVPFGKSGCW